MSDKKKKETTHSLKGLAALVVGAGAFGLFIFLVLGNNNRRPFHEIKWESRKIVHAIATELLAHPATIDSLVAEKAHFDHQHRTGADTASVVTRHTILRKTYLRHLIDLRDSSLSASDVEWAVSAANTVSLVPGSYDLAEAGDKDVLPVLVNFQSNRIPGLKKTFPVQLQVSHKLLADDFLTKYSLFGLWAMLIVLQLTFFTLLIPWLYYKLYEPFINGKDDDYTPDPRIVSVHWSACVLVCLLFYYFLLVADGNSFVKPQYFMTDLQKVLGITNLMGYFAAGLCLAGMLLIYVTVRRVKERVAGEGETEEKVLAERQQEYRDAEQRFNHYFMILATILTLGALATSSLFSGLNSLPFVKEVTKAQGFSPFPSDFVYLYGIVHSAVLLVAYLQIRAQLKELQQTLKIEKAEAANISLSKKLIDLMVAGSPLLGPILQSVFGQF
jgi:hypothetical protein